MAEQSGVATAHAAQVDYRDHYYPGTEELSPNEMRVSALGTTESLPSECLSTSPERQPAVIASY